MPITRAMVLAAGRGERMRPLTDTVPKALLTINGKPLIEYHIEKLAALNINNIVINHAWLGEQIITKLGDGSKFGVNISYSPEPIGGLETAGGIIQALVNNLGGLNELPFLIISADVWTDIDYAGLKLSSNKLAHLVLVENPSHHTNGDFGLANNGIVNLNDNNKFTFSGIGVFHPKFFANLKPQKLALRPLLEKFINCQQITAQLHRGSWSDVGTVTRLKKLQE